MPLKKRCKARTLKGTVCKKYAQEGGDLCVQHAARAAAKKASPKKGSPAKASPKKA